MLAAAILMAADFAVLCVALAVAGSALAPVVGWMPGFVFAALVGTALCQLAGLYDREAWQEDEFRRVAGVTAVLTMLLVAGVPGITLTGALAFWCGSSLALVFTRMALRAVPVTGNLMQPVMVLVGLGVERDRFAYQMRACRMGAGKVLRGAPIRALAGLDAASLHRWLVAVAARAGVPVSALQVVLVPAAKEQGATKVLARQLVALGQPHVLGLTEGLPARPQHFLRTLGSDVVLADMTPRRPGPWDHWMKRALDICLVAPLLVLLAPLFAVIWAGLVAEGGPVLFRQRRVGRHGRRFTCLKFRTMRPDAEDRLALLLDCSPKAQAEWARHQKLTDDPRVTRLGRVLRASSLDELPQLINVLKGDMSLVGPRPIIAPEVPGYDADLAYFQSPSFPDYAECTPGITGLWQVCGRHRTSHAERVRLDRWYARNCSVWLDLLLLIRTVRVVLVGDGR